MENRYWNEETFGSAYPPVNMDEVCSEANSLIDAFAESCESDDDLDAYCNSIWEAFCETGVIGNVTAIYED